MNEFEEAFRSALRRIDAAPGPATTLEPAAVVARARAAAAPVRAAVVRRLMLVAALVLVAGIGLVVWLGRQHAPVPAVPVPTPTDVVLPAPVVVGPLNPEPASEVAVVVDDASLTDVASIPLTTPDEPVDSGQPAVPSGYFVDGDTIYVDDPLGQQIVSYRDGRRVDQVAVPTEPFASLAVYQDVYYLLGDRLRAYTRQAGGLVEISLPSELATAADVSGLVMDDGNLVAVRRSGERLLVAGPGPLSPAPDLALTAHAATVATATVNAEIRLTGEPIGVSLLGTDAEHAWYQVCESWWEDDSGNLVQCYVVEFDVRGRHTATYTPVRNEVDFDRGLAVGGGRVYQLVLTGRGVQIRRLQPVEGQTSPTAAPIPLSEAEVAAALGDPPAGFRWVTYAPVDHPDEVTAVAVPEQWTSFASPGRDYCFAEPERVVAPPGPYVDLNHGTSQGHAADCAPLPAEQQHLHVSITDVGVQTDPAFPWAGGHAEWRQWSVALGRTVVTVTGLPADADLADQILATAQVVRR